MASPIPPQNGSSRISVALGSVLFRAWNISSQKAAELSVIARQKYEEGSKTNVIPIINSLATRCCYVIPGLVTPYPFSSITSIIDFMIREAIHHTSFDKDTQSLSINEIMESNTYNSAYLNYRNKFLSSTLDWRCLIITDHKSAKAEFHPSLETLAEVLDSLSMDELHHRIDAILKPFFDDLFRQSKRISEPKAVIKKAELALGKLMMKPNARRYQDYLFSLVQDSVRTLAQSDQAMRYLGSGFYRAGLDKLLNKTMDAVRMVSVYATIKELSEAENIEAHENIRQIKLTSGRKYIKPIFESGLKDHLIQLTCDVIEVLCLPQEQRSQRKPHISHIEELADDLITDDRITSVPIFNICSTHEPIGSINLFDKAYEVVYEFDSV